MENLGDILRRVATTRGPDGGGDRQGGHEDPSTGGEDQTCPLCGGRGWYAPDVPAGDPAFGRVVTCRCQEERLQGERYGRLLRYSNLGYLTRFTFETLRPKGLSEDPEDQELFRKAFDEAQRYAREPEGWLVLLGPHGAGKTHLAAAIANRRLELGHPVFFSHVPDLLDHLRASFAPTSEVPYSELFEQVRDAPLLVLDDLAAHAVTPWAQEKLQQLVNHRYNARLPTVITTAAELAEVDPYIRSRIEAPGLSRIVTVRRRTAVVTHRLGQVEPQLLRRMTFETFDVRGNNPTAQQRASLEAAYTAARNYAADPDGWITFFGDTGVGKTHLAVAIAGQRLKEGQPVFFAFVPELMDYLRYTFNPESRISYDRLFEEVKNAPLLVLDDLGEEYGSPWAVEKLYQIIVHRHNARLPTVITSRMDFTRQTGPITSRVQDPSVGQLVRIDAPDYRNKRRTTRRR